MGTPRDAGPHSRATAAPETLRHSVARQPEKITLKTPNIRRLLGRTNGLAMLLVVVPTLLALVYFSFIASDVYLSESRFVVRSPERMASPLGALIRGVGLARAQDDSYSVQEYILSRDALAAVDQQVGMKAKYGSPEVDRISRFAGLDFDDSFEALHKYYQKMVKVQTDGSSSITILTVRAFDPKMAADANRVLLEKAEDLVNRLNRRARQDMIKYATDEVAQAEKKSREAALALAMFRNQQGVLDPERQATAQLQQVSKLQDELIATTMQLSQLRTTTPQNPQIPVLVTRVAALQREIANETSKSTGGKNAFTRKSAEFQRLTLESELANRQLGSAITALENAGNEAQRQQVYLERISQPSLPDSAQEPHRIRNIIATLVVGILLWGVFSMLIQGVREHQD